MNKNNKSNKKHIITLIDHGIGYCTNNVIEINRILLEYPDLFEEILEHELEHFKGSSLMNDIKTDFLPNKYSFNFKRNLQWFFFHLKHPIFSLQTLRPVWHNKGALNYNGSVILSYLFFILIFLIMKYYF